MTKDYSHLIDGILGKNPTDNKLLELFDQIFDKLSDPITVTDKDGKVIFHNKAFLTLLDKPSNQVLGENWLTLFPELTFIDQSVEESEESSNLFPPMGKVTFISSNNVNYTFAVKSDDIAGGNIEPLGWVIKMTDITEQEIILESESITNHFLGISSDVGRYISEGLPLHTLMDKVLGSIMLQVDLEAGYIYTVDSNKTSATLQVQRNLADVFLSAIKSLNLELSFVQKLVEYGRPMVLTDCLEPGLKLTEFLYKFGYEHTVSMALFNKDQLVGFLNLVPPKPLTVLEMNLFENLGSQLALAIGNALLVKHRRESDRKYSTVVERANDGIMISQDDEFRFVNKQLADMLEYTVFEMTGMKISQIMNPKDSEELLRHYKARISGTLPQEIYQGSLVTKSGKPLSVEFNACTIQYEGHPASLSFVRDITSRISLQKQVVQQKEMAEFYNDILTHDIINFCHTLMGNIDNLAEDMPVDISRDFLKKLNTCKNNIKMISHIIDRVREMMFIQTIKPENLVPQNLDDTITEAIEIAHESLPAENVQISASVPKDAMILGNNLTILIFINLLTNAIKHNDKDEKLIKVNVQSTKTDEREGWMIEIKDNGPGIPEENREEVFKRFQRFSKREGKGLGLPIVNALVNKMMGGIFLSQDAADTKYCGITVSVLLPKA